MNARSNYLLKVVLAFALSVLITTLLIIPAKAVAQSNFDDPYRVETFKLSDTGSLDVKTSGGHITVEGSSPNSVRVEMYVRKDGRDLTPDDIDLDDWEIDISQSGQSIKAIAKRKNSGWSFFGSNDHPSISFVVYTPRKMSTDLNTSGGHISISNLQGELNTRTSGGNINLANISGTVEARTSGGNIEADFISIGSSVDLQTSGGNINIILPDDYGLDLNLKGSLVHTDLDNFSGRTERDQVEGEINGGGASVSAHTSGGIVSLSFK